MILKTSVNNKHILRSLFWGSFTGSILAFTVIILFVQEPPAGLAAFLLYFAIGLIAGVFTHALIIRKTWVPKLTWLMLAFMLWIEFPIGNLVNSFFSIDIFRMIISARISYFFEMIDLFSPIAAFGLWVTASYYSLKRLSRPATYQEKINQSWLDNNGRFVLSLVLMLILYGLVALVLAAKIASFAGIGFIGIFAMTLLAVYGSSSRIAEKRTPLFLMSLWFFPTFLFVLSLFYVISSS